MVKVRERVMVRDRVGIEIGLQTYD